MHKTSRPGISKSKGHPHQIMTVMKWRLSRPNRTGKPIYTMDMTTEKIIYEFCAKMKVWLTTDKIGFTRATLCWRDMAGCLSVCLSVTSQYRVETDGRLFAWRLPSTYPILCCKEIRVSLKITLNKGITIWNFVPNSSENFAAARIISDIVIYKVIRVSPKITLNKGITIWNFVPNSSENFAAARQSSQHVVNLAG